MTAHDVVLNDWSGRAFDPRSPDVSLTPPVDLVPTVPVLLSRAVERFGDRTFVVTAHEDYSFREIDRASRILAKHLIDRGVGKGTRVGILLAQGPSWIIGFLGAARAGALVMTFSTFYTPAELARSLRHGDVELLIVSSQMFGNEMIDFVVDAVPGLKTSPGTRALLPDLPFLRSVTVLGTPADEGHGGCFDVLDVFQGTNFESPVDDTILSAIESEIMPADLLITIYTSGTTSDPKGVVHTHGSQIRHGMTLARLRSYSSESSLFTHMPFFWVGGFTCALIPALYAGATLITQDKLDVAGALDLIERHRATHLVAWPNVRQRLLTHPSYQDRDFSDIPFLPMPGTQVADPGLIHNSLGMTETSGPHSAAGVGEASSILSEDHRGSFGQRVPYVQHRIADPETNETLEDGAEGEVCIRGYSVMNGLYKREREDVFDAAGWYHTGDRAHFRDDLLFFHGRYGEMIKTSGSNVAPREVEVQLEMLPGVKVALVFGLPDDERGQIVVAAVVTEPNCILDVEDLRTSVGNAVSVYKVPREIVVLDDVPLLASGKPDRRRVEKLLSDKLLLPRRN